MSSWLPFLVNVFLGVLIVVGIPIAILRMRGTRNAAITREIADRRALIESRQHVDDRSKKPFPK